MAEDRESTDRKSEKSKKRDRHGSSKQNAKINKNVWTGSEKLQLAEAIDMYGIRDFNRLAERVPTKKRAQVEMMIKQLRHDNRKEAECNDMKTLSFIDLNTMDDLFLVGDTKPKEVMLKWLDYLDSFYTNDAFKYNKFKLFARAFLIMSECFPEPEVRGEKNDQDIDFRKVYYFLYRMFNNYNPAKDKNYYITKKYLYDMFRRVLNEIEYSSDNEKIAMYNIVKNWTSVNRTKNLRVYGKTNHKTDNGEVEVATVAKFKVLEQPMIPCFNPLRLKSSQTKSDDTRH